MKNLTVHKATEYLRANTGVRIDSLEAYPGGLPPFLDQLYGLHVLHTALGRFLMIESIGEEPISPAKYEKHLARIMKTATDFESACVVFERLPFYARQRYAHKGIAFIVPGIQLNWPELGLALQQRSRAGTRHTHQAVLPATQLLLLYAVSRGISDPTPVKTVADLLSYSPMSISRAFDQIETNGMGKLHRAGRERVVTFNANRLELWHQIAPFLHSPVAHELRLLQEDLVDVPCVLAGESALARYTTLIDPPEKIYAISPGAWAKLKAGIEEIPVADEFTCILQVWRYDPGILESSGVVDPYSLWLSLKHTADERLQIALDKLRDKEADWQISSAG